MRLTWHPSVSGYARPAEESKVLVATQFLHHQGIASISYWLIMFFPQTMDALGDVWLVGWAARRVGLWVLKMCPYSHSSFAATLRNSPVVNTFTRFKWLFLFCTKRFEIISSAKWLNRSMYVKKKIQKSWLQLRQRNKLNENGALPLAHYLARLA